jgi:hypothetical protein
MEVKNTAKLTLAVEVIGEPESGKSHCACTLMPKPLVLDTTAKREAQALAMKLLPDWEKRYLPINELNDIKLAVKKYENDNEYLTFAIDTSADLQKLAVREWLQENPTRKAPLQIEYGAIREKIDVVVGMITAAKKNLLLTAGMKDEVKSVQTSDGRTAGIHTGKRMRDGYVKSPIVCDIRLYLEVKEETKDDKPTGKYVRTCRVVKNRFRDRIADDWIPYLNPINWEELAKLTKFPKEVLVM